LAGVRLLAFLLFFAACTATRAQVQAAPTVESVESHLESTREFETASSTQPAVVKIAPDPGGAIYSPFSRTQAPDAPSPNVVAIRGDDGGSDAIATLIAVLACSIGLGFLFLAWRRGR
jgi:hypothetical protein